MLDVLYYGGVSKVQQWRWTPFTGSVAVGYYLPNALRKKVRLTYYPPYTANRAYLMDLLKTHSKFILGRFDIIHLNRDVVWVNGSRIMLELAKVRNTRVILNIHRMPLPTLSCSNAIDRIVVNSKYMRAKVAAWYGISRRKVVVIPNGVDVGGFSGSPDKVVLEGDPVILYLGGISRNKGVDVLFKAIDFVRIQLPQTKLHILGPGSMSEFRLQAKKKGIEKYLVFHGQVSNFMVPCYYKAADICVLPSRNEAFGIVILEAMASRVPVIASDVGGIPETISDGENGIIFKAGEANDLSRKILALSRDSGLGRKISQNAARKVIEYDWNNIAERYLSLYNSLLE